ncbi:MAG TPA: hypothetical protein VLV16_13015 [Gemmatimonadales bacterium]|nr:hypothetical protein [Gemmatimonadales bacterium]
MVAKSVLTCTIVLLATPASTVRADAIPAFARLHRVSCSLCHDPIPRLTPFGEMFVGNGYRFAPDQPPPDGVPTGDPLLELPERLRLAIRLDAFATAYTDGKAVTDFQTPYNVKIVSGGPLSDNLSYYLYFMFAEHGATGGLEDAYVTWNDVAGAPVSVSVGQFQVSDPIFPRELRLEHQDYAIYRARIGSTPVDLTYDRGLMVGADLAGFTLTGEVVNGNGNGAASTSDRFDDDPHKSFLGHIRREVVKGVTLGALGYATHQEGAAPGGPTVVNELWMLGGDASVGIGPVTLRAQFIHREDGSPTFTLNEPRVITNGGFAEVLWHRTGARSYAIALYNLIDASQPLLDVRLGGPAGMSRYEAVTGGLGYLMRRNVRAHAEGTWDRELGTTQWTLGLTMAF